MTLKHKIAMTVVNFFASWLMIWRLESGGVLLPFIVGCVLVIFNGAVIDLKDEI